MRANRIFHEIGHLHCGLLLLSFSFFAFRVEASENSPVAGEQVKAALAQLDQLAEQSMQKTGVPGMAIAVVYQDQVVYAKGFGLREAGKPDVVDADTVFQLASVSKSIAVTVVAALVGDGLVRWDDPVTKHDPGFQMYDPWVTREVTLRDFFCHRSGLPDHGGDLLEDMGYDRTTILYRLRYLRPDSSFRSHYAYTNFGFTEAAVAAAKAAGKSWEDLCDERLYQPLGMKRTSSRHADFVVRENRVRDHVLIEGKWVAKYDRNPDAQSPAGGVSSSVRDVSQWLCLCLEDGKIDGKQIVGREALDETFRPQFISRSPRDPWKDRVGLYGLGWNVSYTDQGRLSVGHSGGFDLGAATNVQLLPSAQIGIVVLTNASPIGLPETVSASFLDLVQYGKLQRDWAEFFRVIFAAASAPNYGTAVDYSKAPSQPTPALSNVAYVGSYDNDLYGQIEVRAKGDDLLLLLGPEKRLVFLLKHFDRDVFSYQPVGEMASVPAGVTFTVGADGKASSVTIENLNLTGQGIFLRTKHGQ